MTTNENSGSIPVSPHLNEMIRKLDNRGRDAQGYVTTTPELVGIIRELSPTVPVAILQQRTPFPDDKNDYVSVEVKLSFLIGRSELAELQARADKQAAIENGS